MVNRKITSVLKLVVFIGLLAAASGFISPPKALAALPDLVIQSSSLTANAFSFSVMNNGASTTSGGFDISYRWVQSNGVTFTGSDTVFHIGNLANLGIYTFTMSSADVQGLLQYGPSDAVYMQIKADATALVTESNESNNAALISRPRADLALERSVLDANNFSITIRNIGAPFRTVVGYVQWYYRWLDASGGNASSRIYMQFPALLYNETYTYTASPAELRGFLAGIPDNAQTLYISINPAYDPLETGLDNNGTTLPRPILSTPTPAPTPTPTPTPASTPTPSPLPTQTPTPTPTPIPTLVPFYTPKPSLTPTPTPAILPSYTPKPTLRPTPLPTVLPPQIPKTTAVPTPAPEILSSPSAEPVGERQATVSAEFSIKESDIRELRVPVRVEAGAKLNVRGWNLEKKEEITSKPDAVRTGEELKTYAEALAVSDENIKKLGVAGGGVEIAYAHRGKMLGFIPWGYTVSASVSKTGGAKVKFPWYSVFLKKDLDAADLTEEIETDLRKLESDEQLLQMQNEMAKLSRTFQLLSNIMKARHDAAQSAIRNIK